MGLNVTEAVQLMREGKRVRRGGWGREAPSFVVLIPGRDVTPNNKPMVEHLGEGTPFHVQDHVDAIFYSDGPEQPICKVGYEFTQEDVLAADWYIV